MPPCSKWGAGPSKKGKGEKGKVTAIFSSVHQVLVMVLGILHTFSSLCFTKPNEECTVASTFSMGKLWEKAPHVCRI